MAARSGAMKAFVFFIRLVDGVNEQGNGRLLYK